MTDSIFHDEITGLSYLAAPEARAHIHGGDRMSDNPALTEKLNELLAKATEWARTASAAEKAEMHLRQKRSWVIGEMGLQHPELSPEELSKLFERTDMGWALAEIDALRGQIKARDTQIKQLTPDPEVLKDSAGFWRSCSGCYETVDGYPSGHYPYSKAYGCTLGSGCSECGGIGAIWDTTNYEEMGAFIAAEISAEERAAAAEAKVRELTKALEPFARLEIPKRPHGNAAAYSIFHSDIERARAATGVMP